MWSKNYGLKRAKLVDARIIIEGEIGKGSNLLLEIKNSIIIQQDKRNGF